MQGCAQAQGGKVELLKPRVCWQGGILPFLNFLYCLVL